MRRNKEAGQALVFVAGAMVVLLGMAGLGVDMGVVRYEKRIQQSAADAAALAGANNLAYPASGGVIAGGQNASAANGFTDNAGGALSSCTAASATVGTICVQISDPSSGPTTGPHAGNPKYVEAYVSEVHETYFMKIFGVTKQVVTARAVATNTSGGTESGCLYTLGPPSASIEGVNINGNATLNATTCGIVDNGNFNTKGNALVVNADTFGESGNTNASGPGGTVTCVAPGPCPSPNMPAATDPLAGLPSPCTLGYACTGGTALSANGSATFNPGTYTSIALQGNGTVTFNPGVYVVDGPSGGFTCSGTPTITGTGVMFYFTNGSTFSCQGNDTITLTAPNSTNCPACPSQYYGLLMFQDPTDTNVGPAPAGPALGGNTGSSYTGALYFPADQVTFYGNNVSYSVGMVVSQSIALSGHPTVNLTGNLGLPPGASIVTVATLVE